MPMDLTALPPVAIAPVPDSVKVPDLTASLNALPPVAIAPAKDAVKDSVTALTPVEVKNLSANKDDAANAVKKVDGITVPTRQTKIEPAALAPANSKSLALSSAGAKPYSPNTNPLYAAATYTYNLSLHVLDITAYNNIVTDPLSYKPSGNVLIASGGRWADQRHPAFSQTDFYFEKLSINSVLGMTEHTKASNALTVEFTIIEPYGFTLMNRILTLADKIGKDVSYTKLPYLLRIEFMGFDDNGKSIGQIGETKSFPINILTMKMKVGTKGAEYEISAIPFSHQAFRDTIAATPVNIVSVASTVGEFFDETRTKPTKSYTAMYNTWHEQLEKDKKLKIRDKVLFEVAPNIKKGTFPDSKFLRAKAATPVDKADSKETGLTIKKVGNDNSMTISIPDKMPVTEVIGMVVKNSSYIYDQIIDFTREKIARSDIKRLLETPLKWFKITPSIILGDYDSSRDEFQKTITYRVTEYDAFNTKTSFANMGKPNGYVKDYQYIFTGHNTDILNFDLSFDTAYFTVKSSNPKLVETTAGQQTTNPTGKVIAKDEELLSQEEVFKLLNEVMKGASGSADFKPTVVHTTNAVGGAANPDVKSESIKELQRNLFAHAQADQITVNLKIVGDPEFIKQDDVFIKAGDEKPNGSIPMDLSELFVRLKFKTPADYNDKGLAIPSDSADEFTTSPFSGLYKIITVNNIFSGGKFEQDLTLVRFQNQADGGDDENKSAPNTAASAAREELPAGVRSPQDSSSLSKSLGAVKQIPSIPPLTALDLPVPNVSLGAISGGLPNIAAPSIGDPVKVPDLTASLNALPPVAIAPVPDSVKVPDLTSALNTLPPVAIAPVPFADAVKLPSVPITSFIG